jgi:hypothetical protein
MEVKMRKSIGITTAVVLAIATIVVWANASIRTDAALNTLGPMTIETQIDTTELTKAARDLPVQNFDAF